MLKYAIATLTICFCVSETANAQSWHQFRGPAADGSATAKNLPVQFGEQKNLDWKTKIPGRAWSSPVVADGQIWLTNAIEIEATGEQKKEKLKKSHLGGMSAYASVKLQAILIDQKTGKITAQIDLTEVKDPPLINTLNSFASPTPIIDGDSIIFNFGSFGTFCLNRKTRKTIWKNNDYKIDHQTGPGSSPFIYRDLLILNFDGIDDQFVVALEKKTGKEVWRTRRSGKLNPRPDLQKAFTTPIVIDVDGQKQLISVGADWVYAYQPESGKEIWRVKFGKLGFSNAPQPVLFGGKIMVCTGFPKSRVLAIDPKSKSANADVQRNIVWEYAKQVPCMPTPIVVKNRMYFVSDRGIVTCVNAANGKEIWQRRLGGSFSSSPIFADGKLYFCNRDGKVFVVKPGDKYQVMATNQLDSRVMATPAVVGSKILIRTEKSLYLFSKKD